MTTRRQLVPDVISDQDVVSLKRTATVRQAAVLMDKQEISSVLVTDEADKLCGIFTVRDVARRIVGGGLDPDTTSLTTVMTKNPECIAAKETPQTALRKMQEGGFRHLPVTEDGTPASPVLGVVSRRSFFPDEEALLKFEEHLWEHMR